VIVLTAQPTFDAGPSLQAVQDLASRFPGRETLQIRVGASRLSLGPLWRVAQCTGLLVALSEFGDVEVTQADA
jgi:hypothetical protein